MNDFTALQAGTWVRMTRAVTDSGDHNEREAPAGSIGRIESREGSGATTSYEIVMWPSYVSGYWDADELAEDATLVPAGHPDIPSAAEEDFASAVADLLADGDLDKDGQTLTAGPEVVDRIVAGAREGRYAGNPRIAELFGEGDCEVTLSWDEFNEIAGFAGIGDRLPATPVPEPRR